MYMTFFSVHAETYYSPEETERITRMKKMMMVLVAACVTISGFAIGASTSERPFDCYGYRCVHCNGTGFNGNFNCWACKGTGRIGEY